MKRKKMSNSDILEALFIHYRQPVYRICFGILGNVSQAEDAAADTFERLVKYLPDCAGITDERTRCLVVRVTKCAALDIYRQNQKEMNLISIDEHAYLGASKNDIDDYLDIKNYREMLGRIISELPEIYAGVIRLRFFYGLEIAEIAKQLNISEDNVYQRIGRARKWIKNMIGDEAYEKKVR